MSFFTAEDARKEMINNLSPSDKEKIVQCDNKIMEALLKGYTYTSCDYDNATTVSLLERGFDAKLNSDFDMDRDNSNYRSWLAVSWSRNR